MDCTKMFEGLHLGVSGDSITQGDQWSAYVFKALGFSSHHNTAVGSSVWCKRRVVCGGKELSTQDYGAADFAGISGGWEPDDDPAEMQMRMNNCAVVHIDKFISEVDSGEYPAPDVFVFAYGTNDGEELFGDPEAALGSQPDLFTTTGAMRHCIQRIAERFPKCRVFVMTPIQAANPSHNEKNRRLIPLMRRVCEGMSVQVIDCFAGAGICEKFEIPDNTGRYLRDGLHPHEAGQELEGRFVAKEIRNNFF